MPIGLFITIKSLLTINFGKLPNFYKHFQLIKLKKICKFYKILCYNIGQVISLLFGTGISIARLRLAPVLIGKGL